MLAVVLKSVNTTFSVEKFELTSLWVEVICHTNARYASLLKALLKTNYKCGRPFYNFYAALGIKINEYDIVCTWKILIHSAISFSSSLSVFISLQLQSPL